MTEHRVLIVEDHEVVTRTLALALRAESFVVEVADDLRPELVLSAAERFRPDVVLLDIDLGEHGSGIDLVPVLVGRRRRVLMLTGARDRLLWAESLEAGASGFFLKSDSFAELVDVTRHLINGESVVPATMRAELLEELRRARSRDSHRRERFDQLTAREAEVLEALVAGKSAEAIASERFVSLNTIRTHIRAVLMKLNVNSQIAAVAVAREAGWPWADPARSARQ